MARLIYECRRSEDIYGQNTILHQRISSTPTSKTNYKSVLATTAQLLSTCFL